jgi:hypothetical protein
MIEKFDVSRHGLIVTGSLTIDDLTGSQCKLEIIMEADSGVGACIMQPSRA